MKIVKNVMKILSLMVLVVQLTSPALIAFMEETEVNESSPPVLKLFGLINDQKAETITVETGETIQVTLSAKALNAEIIQIDLSEKVSISQEEMERINSNNEVQISTSGNIVSIQTKPTKLNDLLLNLNTVDNGTVQLQAAINNAIFSNVVALDIIEKKNKTVTEESTINQTEPKEQLPQSEIQTNKTITSTSPETTLNPKFDLNELSYFIINGGFEQPAIAVNNVNFFAQDQVPGWETTASDKAIEIASGTGSGHRFRARSGQQWAEINANVPGELHQVVKSIPGSTMKWSVWHAGRDGTNRMAIHIGTIENHPTVAIATTANRVWTQYTGTYVVPENQYETYFGFESLQATRPSVGNYIDDVSFKIEGNLETTKQANKSLVKTGERVGYTINVSNTIDFSLLDNIIVEDTLPEGLKLVTDTLAVDGVNVMNEATEENQIKTQINTIEGGKTVAVTFEAEVTSEMNGTLKNIAIVTDPDNPSEPQNPEVLIEVKGNGKLITKKLVDQSIVKTGDEVTYTIEASNVQTNTVLNNIEIADLLPEGLELIEDTLTIDDRQVENTATEMNEIKTLIDTIEGNQTVSVRFKAKVIQETSGTLQNIATVTDPNNPTEPQKPEVSIEIEAPGKLETKKLADRAIVELGDEISYTIQVTNSQADTILKDIKVEDVLPEELELVKDTLNINGNSVTNDAVKENTVQTMIKEIKGGQTIDIVFKAIVISLDNLFITNTAEITDPANPDMPQKPSATIESPTGSVGGRGAYESGKLKTRKLVDQSNVKTGDEITYTIEASNDTEDTMLYDIVVEDKLPEGLKLIKDTLTVDNKKVVNTTSKDNIIKTTIAEIEGNQTVVVQFKAKITRETNGTIKNIAHVTNPEIPEEPQKPEVSINISAIGKLESNKRVSQSLVKVGEEVIYAIEAANSVPNTTLNDVIVEDHLPKGLELIQDTLTVDGKKVNNESKEPNTIKVKLQVLEGKQRSSVQFKAKVTKPITDKITNIAMVAESRESKTPQKPEVSIKVISEKKAIGKSGVLPKMNMLQNKFTFWIGLFILFQVYSFYYIRRRNGELK